MAQRVRFKRHIRFLEAEGKVRSLSTINEGVDLPGGEPFARMIDAITPMPPKEHFIAVLSRAMGVTQDMAKLLSARLFETGLIEYFDDERKEHSRFDRQLHLFDVLSPVKDHQENIERQDRLNRAQVLVLGLGGVGHQVALSLAASGVGSLVLVDDDVVEESNLHRQVLFTHADVRRPKVDAAREGLLRIAPACHVQVCRAMVGSQEQWRSIIATFPGTRYVMISADRPVQLVSWISTARAEFHYHAIKCGYMGVQGIIGPMVGPDTSGYDELFESWGPLVDAQTSAVKRINEMAVAPTMAASNAIMANIAALELIKHITGVGGLRLMGCRLLLDLRDYSTCFG
ncbi:MAG: ThiF family adenylyltransferase [Bacteroidetes bacterium]|nr:ThiF family adenylyltransferase [Bacteroidota bacterium]MBX7128977.1 ThiF family adenylyltransferase [Flavobacteriales bacterium]MCC6655495.1 ThiF family adenylyltransferase [Flavobacteriales bacterium]HMU12680.1 ThiF family adenylyltransferase [Flavobacteriales bacterium]HMW97292.1 ThiF family adenylyltransferase [Flavobacteriales bacterium]